MSSLGNLFAPKVETPDFTGITEGLRSQITGQGGGDASAIRSLGLEKLTEGLGTDRGAAPDELFAQSDRLREEQLGKELTNLERMFKSANPNVNIANNSAYQEARNEVIERSNELGRTIQI